MGSETKQAMITGRGQQIGGRVDRSSNVRTIFVALTGSVRDRSTRWLVRLGRELESPLNQIQFFLALAGLILGLLAGWSLLVAFVVQHWIPILAALLGSFLITLFIRLFSRSREPEGNPSFRRGQAAILRLLAASPITRDEAIRFLRGHVGDQAEEVFLEFVRTGVLKVQFDGYVRANGGRNEHE